MLLFAVSGSDVYPTYVLHKVSEGCWFPFGNSSFLRTSKEYPAKSSHADPRPRRSHSEAWTTGQPATR